MVQGIWEGRKAENVVVVEEDGKARPIGVARAADILRLRRWIVEEEIG
jgi:hypothetical protein